MQVEKKIGVARGQCIMDEPFVGTLLCRLIIKERNDIPTMEQMVSIVITIGNL